ncbi:hypothetical protein [Bradyrhizobium elkanii]|uniref:hypothetical protein n=1 Tax=Bradyrhizobium elkanii TaxID=29448 RepID=UPI00209DBCC1|nr:hypothetical protein [Bradyrhizobium elkanii]MCP1926388.1 hypothetical protein [Bradyrhizobium elkanii]
MARRDVIGCSFGIVGLLGLLLFLAFGTSTFFSTMLGISEPLSAIFCFTGLAFCVIGCGGLILADPLLTG